MSVELLRILKNEAKYASEDKKSGRWLKRKETIRAQRVTLYRNSLRKERTKRQIENATETSTIEAGPRKSASPPSRVSAGEIEWSGVTGGPPAEVVLRLHPSTSTYPGHNPRTNYSTSYIERSKVTDCPPAEVISRLHPTQESTYPDIKIANLSLTHFDGSGVVVRAEEALIVAFVLLLWVAAIALFFNRWGKIRMLEPYQPKFQQQHRQSCALAEASVSVPPHHRASLSRGCVSYDCGVSFSAYQPCGYLAHRPRQNSVFVGSMGGMALIPESPPRRSRSVADLPALVTPSDHATHTPRSSRAASLHSAVDLRVCASPRTSRAASLHSTADMQHVQVHVRGSVANVNKPRSPRRLTITNV
ncbi:uncharacterized protein LOC123872478 isoform X1 [Maniola jurtina]|uniref:uncharacterized protein LOC123872478 isoform X1 n=1 Tax=Maniola jurtina TaxID=191418 RepID=UPI001E6863F1|nr:uncharacterized protein LOC123872478 isoform X1 [Maniola jurtina]